MADEPLSDPPWSDEPRKSLDIPGRNEFAQMVANRIDGCVKGQGSTVFGLVGPWGSGKTTLLNGVVGELSEWVPVWFSPWSVADVESLTNEFVSVLAEGFAKSEAVKQKLKRYARFGAPVLKLIPVFGDAVTELTEVAIAEFTKRSAWHTEFRALSDEIAAQGQRVLVVVDDVDRLDGEELRSLLRVVRLLGRFTNVHYLLAYDQSTIDQVLDSMGTGGKSSEFMEKIVQHPFEVPPVPMVVRRRWSRAILAESGTREQPAGSRHSDCDEQLVRILAGGLETPRAAERLSQQVRSLAALAADAEVDTLDFAALTWLRIAHHQVWDHIRLHPSEYLSWRESDDVKTWQARMDQIAALVPRGHAGPVQDAVRYLFEPANVFDESVGRKGRMQNDRYFDRYFQVVLDEDDVSERRVEKALRALSSGSTSGIEIDYLRDIVVQTNEERSLLALDVAFNFRSALDVASLEVLAFVEEISKALEGICDKDSPRFAAASKWLSGEIFLILKSKSHPLADWVARFGYLTIIRSASAAKRSRRYQDAQIRATYAEVAVAWFGEIAQEGLAATLKRLELTPMTFFCVWSTELESYRGFLSKRLSGTDTLIDIASKFVSYKRWVGAEVSYEVEFLEAEFRFAVGESLTTSLLGALPAVRSAKDYDVSDRAKPDLSEDQVRDFATRSIRDLKVL